MSLTTESEARFNTFYHALLDEFVLPRDPHLLLRFKELYLENFEGVAPGESFALAKLLVPSRLKVVPIKQEEKSALELAPQFEPAEGALGPETEHPPFVPFTESEPVTADPISVGEPTSAQSFPEPSAPGTESVAE